MDLFLMVLELISSISKEIEDSFEEKVIGFIFSCLFKNTS